MKEFRKRGGTTNEGIEFENLNIGNIVLKLVKNPEVNNFYISANDEQFGAFDDVVVELELENNTEIYALQLKHNDRGNLSLAKLRNKNGDFSISKYFDSFKITKNLAQKYILFTNLKFNVEDNTLFQLEGEDFSVGLSKFYPKEVFRISEKTDYCYKFYIVEDTNFKNCEKIREYQTFFNSFYLYVNQDNAHQMKLHTSQKFQEMFCSNEAEFSNYLNIIFEWSKQKGVKEMLNKRWMQRAIALQLLSSRIEPIVKVPVNNKMKIMREAISAFDLTRFEEESCEKVKKLWGDVRFEVSDLKEANKLRQKYQLGMTCINNLNNIDGVLLTKLAWLMGKCPLMVRDDPTVQEAIGLCSKEKFVLFGLKCVNREGENKLVFGHLSDLKKETVIYNNVIRTFTYTLQEKRECTLEDLMQINEEFVENITLDTLLLMLDGPVNIGGAKEVLSDPYIPRYLLNTVTDCKYLEKIDENILVIVFCVPTIKDMKGKFNQHNFIDLDDFLTEYEEKEKETDDLFIAGLKYRSDLMPTSEVILKRMNIYVSKNDYRADYSPLLCQKIQWEQNCHQFRLREDGNLEWIQSKKDIGELEKFRLLEYYSVKEESLWSSQFSNKIHLIISDPGMGKTELLKNFKNNYFDNNVWTVIVNPRDAFTLCENSTEKPNKIDVFEKYIFENKYQNLRGFERNVFKMIWQEKRFILVWDALDEIPDDLLSRVLIIIKEFEKRSLFQLVTSRGHLRKLLEETFNVLSSSLNQFSEKEQLFYIEQRLGDVNSNEEIIEITEKIENTFALFEHKDILGIPLQIFMLTELFRQNKGKYVKLLTNTFALTDIYYHFVEEKFNVHFTKTGVQFQQPFMQTFYNILKNTSLEYYENSALKILFSKEILNQLNVDSKEFSNEIKSAALAIGLITHVDHENPRFLHHSFAEFLAALYFSKNLRFRDTFVTIIFEERYVNVRFFFDLLLAKNSELHIAVLYKNYDLIQQKDEIHSYKDEGGRSVLHVFCSWGRTYTRLKVEKKEECHFIDDDQNVRLKEDEKYLEVLNYLLTTFQTFENDSLFGLTPLTYAKKSNCFIVVLNILHKLNQNLLKTCDENEAINILYYSATLGYDYAINCVDPKSFPVIKTEKDNHSLLHVAVSYNNFIFKLLETNTYKKLIDFENQKGRTPLFVASQNGNFETVESLTLSGAKINRADIFGFTPLYVASWKGHEGIVKLLMKCGAEIDLTEKDGSTPLWIASFYGQLTVVDLLTRSGAKVNHADTPGSTPLFVATQNGHLEIVKLLIKCGAEIDLADQNGSSPLSIASSKGHLKVVEFLITSGARVNHATKSGLTPLYVASGNGHEEVVKLLIKFGAEIDLAMEDGITPLSNASFNGHLNVVKILTTFGAKINQADTSGFTPLFVSAQNGHLEIMKLLIKCGAEINLSTHNDSSPLLIASSNGHLKLVEFLLTSGAKVNHANKSGVTSLYIASQKGHFELVTLLITCGAEFDLTNKNGSSPLFAASSNDHSKVVEFLITLGAKINQANKFGITPLYVAAQNGHLHMVKLLTKCGAETDLADENDSTPLWAASFNGHLKVAEFLITSGAKVNHADTSGFTPLFVSAQNGHFELVKFLITCGAKFDFADKNGCSPLFAASSIGHSNVVEFPTTLGANANHPNKFGATPLYVAAQNGHLQIVKLLIKCGAETDLADQNGCTPLWTASFYGHSKVAEFLTTSGAKINHVDTSGFTPLYVACRNGHLEVVTLLIKCGAEMELVAANGSSPLSIASSKGYLKLVELLLTSGAKVNQTVTSGFTPLCSAAQNGHLDIVKLLIQCGVNVNYAIRTGITPLYIASRHGHEEIVKLLIKCGAKIDFANEKGSTPLWTACFKGHLNIVKFLMTSGAKVNQADTSGCTPLYVASRNGHEKVVKLLIKRDAEIDLVNEYGSTPLLVASSEGHLKVVDFLVTSGAKVNHANKYGSTPFYVASQNGHEEIIKLLVKCGAEINLVLKDGSTLLQTAASKGNLKVIEFLVRFGAKVNHTDKSGSTPLYAAAQDGHLEIAKLLIKCGAEIDLANETGSSPLLAASSEGHLKVVEFLVTSGAKVNLSDTSGFTPLYVACQKGHLEIVKLLIKSGAEIDHAIKNGCTPLWTASFNGRLKIVKALIKSGAKVNHADISGDTPLHIASLMGHEKVAKFLIKSGAECDLVNKSGLTPLYIASFEGHLKVAEFLVEFGAKVNQAVTSGSTPLYIASLNGHLNVVEFLIAYGAKVNHANKSGFTALHAACQNGHETIVEFLIKCGARNKLPFYVRPHNSISQRS